MKNKVQYEEIEVGRDSYYDVIVIGGGASGLSAALAASKRGARCLVLERLDAPGKKILASGNGRCNLSNAKLSPAYFRGSEPRFTEPVLSLWTVQEMLSFWKDLGLATRQEEDRYYPYSLQARSVLNILTASLLQSTCNLKTGKKVEHIQYRPALKLKASEAKYKESFLITCSDGERFVARKLILCAGGMAAPALGTDGSAYRLYEDLGHRLIKPRPALVQLTCPHLPKRLSGIRCRVGLQLKLESGACPKEYGELLFTDYGLSGICILNLSEWVEKALEEQSKLYIGIDFLPDRSEEQAVELVNNLLRHEALTPALYWGVGFLPEKISVILYEQLYLRSRKALGYHSRKAVSSVDEQKLGDLTEAEIKRLVKNAKSWLIEVNGTKGFAFAQISTGGLATGDFNAYTLESLRVPGLYAAGEVLDVHGPSGGFNLHWAFASGAVAGQQAALALV